MSTAPQPLTDLLSHAGAQPLSGTYALLLLLSVALLFGLPRRAAARPPATNWLIILIFTITTIAIGLVQAYWQLWGWRNPRFIRFYNRYNQRVATNAPKITRGPILDRKGRVIVYSPPGSVWTRKSAIGAAGVHPIGYFNRTYGLTGIERVLDESLSTIDASQSLELLRKKTLTAPPTTLTLDINLQRFAYEQLKGLPGAIVALDPRTGSILALVSSPGFEPNNPAKAIADTAARPAFNRAIHGLYPPGSTFKLFTAALAHEQHCTPLLNCPAEGYQVNRHTPPIRDSEYYSCKQKGTIWRGWGNLTLHNALVHSSNVYFAQLGRRLNPQTFHTVATNLFVPHTLLNAPPYSLGSARPRIPDYTRLPNRLPYAAMGQDDILLTPLDVALLTATIANNGILAEPCLLPKPTPTHRIFPSSATDAVRDAMRDVPRRGTARSVPFHNIPLCAKTGTAQNGTDPRRPHAWFTCFAPVASPRLVLTILVEHGGYGSTTAAPIASAILQEAKRLHLLD
ncbi:MAG: penicillin-binding transpeptidase domain-containing protein [Kiritimatiellia bacterium]|nr:penicillin-binding transpeptidase domain-containing protein [Kiritimatiellia bacterium]